LKYIQAGISTDHECSTQEEAVEKISAGMQILIREGSSARNFEALRPLIDQYPEQVMLCTDDYHPDDLMKGHIDRLIRRGVEEGTGFFNIYKAASLNPVSFYRLPCGTLNPGDPADFLVASSLDPFTVKATYINGTPVFNGQKSCGSLPEAPAGNAFQAKPVTPADLKLKGSEGKYKVIRVYDGELLTGSETAWISAPDGILTPDTHSGIQKIVVLNRYKPAKPAIAFIRGFELKEGALASTIAHDSHNIIAVGCSDVDIADAINAVIREKGGISAASGREVLSLPLPVAGLMTTTSAEEAARGYANMNRFAQLFGSTLKAPFMALSFMALLVIPHLKIGDRGLFDCDTFSFTSLKAD
jgi:adenine deaminase